jgi:elongator complex protein 3
LTLHPCYNAAEAIELELTMQVYRPPIDIEQHREPLLAILRAVAANPDLDREALHRLLRRHLKGTGRERAFFSNDDLVLAYRALAGTHGLPPLDPAVLERLRLKPVRTASGVTTVTVLTKPFPCPGECIFCPNDVRMPKSYLYDEPGAQRAGQNAFDPYLQTWSRLAALRKIGHPTDKIEIIILGGTWSFYPETYQIWFVKRIFDALHDFGAGIDRGDEVRAALRQGSQFQLGEEKPAPDIVVHGEDMALSYNQAVQQLYRAEMDRSRSQADAVGRGLIPRTAITEYAKWDELEAAHRLNEDAPCRCVGLVVETRPDHLDVAEVVRIRRLGCTKVQIGIQSLDDEVLRLNRRGHTVEQTRRAIGLLRRAGFKIHAHWMPNLYGSTPEKDVEDYARLFDDPDFRPDELKIYPCSLIESAELMQRYREGAWQPYNHDDLVGLLAECFRRTPEYCRLTRVIRDIPSTDIVTGNRLTNLRQIVEDSLAARGEHSADIRAREVKGREVAVDDLRLDEQRYTTGAGEEVFLQFITEDRRIAGFLRLLLPDAATQAPTSELDGAAIIREVHVYGQALRFGEAASGRAQHAGLGTRLIERAVEIVAQAGYARLAVISAVGTRGYYRARGFEDGTLYQVRALAGSGSERDSALG